MVTPGMPNMQMLNFNNILNVKDSRWLQLEVCREFQRNKCTRPDTECKFAHPPVNVEVQNGRVTACYDSIKGRCNREKPPCKYFHPPQHLKDQLLINGRNHLALKNAFMTQIQGLSPGTQLMHGTLPVYSQGWCSNVDPWSQRPAIGLPAEGGDYRCPALRWSETKNYYQGLDPGLHTLATGRPKLQPNSPYLAASIPTMANFNPYIASSPVMTMGMTEAVPSPITGVVPQAVVPAQKVPRTDRLEAFPGMGVSYKRPAPDKSGMPVYQPTGNAAYQQALMQQLGGQSYVPVSCEYDSSSGSGESTLLALPPPPNAAQPTAATHSPPATNHNANTVASSSNSPSSGHSESVASSSSTSTSASLSNCSSYSNPTMSALTSAVKANSLQIVSSNASSLPAPHVLPYTGFALNKAIRAQLKPPGSQFVASANAIQAGIPSALAPGAVAPGAISSLGYPFGMAAPVGVNPLQMPGGLTMMSPQNVHAGIGGLVQSAAGYSIAPGMGAGLPSVLSPQLVYSQYPASSVYLPQLSALSNNPQITWAQAGEQPLKKLKTS